MKLIYQLGATAYRWGTFVVSSFAKVFPYPTFLKAAKRVQGARKTLQILPSTPAGQPCYWMHCASLGEYEQGRPVWEKLQAQFPEARFVLSFFSPSGYDHVAPRISHGEVVYLPWDSGNNARKFVSRLSPKLALFVKYEWWLGYHAALFDQRTPYVVVSAAFRQNQPFFKAWGTGWKKALLQAKFVFVQDEASLKLLVKHGFNNAILTGDTRLDRVLTVASEAFSDQVIEQWIRADSDRKILVAGSTWPQDEELLRAALADYPSPRLLIAPHEMEKTRISMLLRMFGTADTTTYSRFDQPGARVLIVDRIGLLSRLYRYGSFAYVGGGFGAGIHNTLEPLVYDLPICFGPNYKRFTEATALINLGIARSVKQPSDLITFLTHFEQQNKRDRQKRASKSYQATHAGATQQIYSSLHAAQLI